MNFLSKEPTESTIYMVRNEGGRSIVESETTLDIELVSKAYLSSRSKKERSQLLSQYESLAVGYNPNIKLFNQKPQR